MRMHAVPLSELSPTIRLLGVASVSMLLWMSSQVMAQDCQLVDVTDPQGNATQFTQSNFTCLSARLSVVLSRIEKLEAELAPFRDAEGAILAFDRKRTEERVCPEGWTYFEPAGGRFLVGAGVNHNGLTDYPSFREDSEQSIGGTEKITLTEASIPEHSHLLEIATAADENRRAQKKEISASLKPGQGIFGNRTLVVGGPTDFVAKRDREATPFSIMPPFIAVYFCEKD